MTDEQKIIANLIREEYGLGIISFYHQQVGGGDLYVNMVKFFELPKDEQKLVAARRQERKFGPKLMLQDIW